MAFVMLLWQVIGYLFNFQLPLKIGWTMLAIIVCAILSFIIMSYSLEKESKINMSFYQEANNSFINLIKRKALDEPILSKSSLIVTSNLLSDNIEDNDVHETQKQVNELFNTILNYMDVSEIKNNIKHDIVRLINNEDVNIDVVEDINDKIILNTVKHIIDLNKKY